MNLYFELLKKPVFTMDIVNQYYNNMDSARSAVKRLMKEKMVAKIRNNMYTCISGETGTPIANRFQIASMLTSTSHISHHTAMEYYGIARKEDREVYVASETSFREFEFDGYFYRLVLTKHMEGVESLLPSGNIEITDLERTIVDSVKDMDKIMGMEGVIQDISCVGKKAREDRILKYLEVLSNQFLYQKVGFMLSDYKDKMGLSDDFFDKCKKEIGKSKRYLTKNMPDGHYNAEWKLVVPNDLCQIENEAVEDVVI